MAHSTFVHNEQTGNAESLNVRPFIVTECNVETGKWSARDIPTCET